MRLDIPQDVPRRRELTPDDNSSSPDRRKTSTVAPETPIQQRLDSLRERADHRQPYHPRPRVERGAASRTVPREPRTRTVDPADTRRARRVPHEVIGLELRAEEKKLLTEVGRFRVVRVEDLNQTIYDGKSRKLENDLNYLRDKGLVETQRVNLRHDGKRRTIERVEVVTLTKAGRSLLIKQGELPKDQKVYAGLVKPRETARYELLKNPAESLWKILRQWVAEHTLSVAEWDLLAIYLQIGAEEQRQVPPVWRPAAPCRESFLGLAEAFASLLQSQKKEVFGKHLWYYFANLDGHNSGIPFSEKEDTEQSYETVRRLIAAQKAQLQSEEDWKYPGSVGRCLLTAIQSEPESRRIDQALAPYWNVLWRIAARGHWLRHHSPVRIVQSDSSGPAERPKFPDGMETRNLRLSFGDGGGGDIAFYLEFRPPRSFTYSILHYPELIEFHAMLEEFGDLPAWNGRYFRATVTTNEGSGETKYTLWPKQQDIEIAFTDKEWLRLRDLFRQAWEKPEITERMVALQLEYGEQG